LIGTPDDQGPRTFLPAAGHDWALPFYDPLVKLLGGDRARRLLIDQANLQPRHRVLEIGCGTGTLLIQIAVAAPEVSVTGLDPDPRALDRARAKAAPLRSAIHLDQGFADALPYPEATFDRVFSCFMFHHIESVDEKRRTLGEVRRVLKPGGQLHVLDFLQPPSSQAGALGWLHAGHRLADNTEPRMLALIRDAGLQSPLSIGYFRATAA